MVGDKACPGQGEPQSGVDVHGGWAHDLFGVYLGRRLGEVRWGVGYPREARGSLKQRPWWF